MNAEPLKLAPQHPQGKPGRLVRLVRRNLGTAVLVVEAILFAIDRWVPGGTAWIAGALGLAVLAAMLWLVPRLGRRLLRHVPPRLRYLVTGPPLATIGLAFLFGQTTGEPERVGHWLGVPLLASCGPIIWFWLRKPLPTTRWRRIGSTVVRVPAATLLLYISVAALHRGAGQLPNSVGRLSLPNGYLVQTLLMIIYVMLIYQLVGNPRRLRLVSPFRLPSTGLFAIILYTAAVVGVAVTLFAVGTFNANRSNPILTSPEITSVSGPKLVTLYEWVLMDSVPLIKWSDAHDSPFTVAHAGRLAGHLTWFRIFALAPIVGTVKTAFKWISDPPDMSKRKLIPRRIQRLINWWTWRPPLKKGF
jgi:hypothetical protein